MRKYISIIMEMTRAVSGDVQLVEMCSQSNTCSHMHPHALTHAHLHTVIAGMACYCALTTAEAE